MRAFLVDAVWAIAVIAICAISTCASACVEAADYKTPAVGITATGAVQQCRQNPSLPCGWVHQCGDAELCLPWEDRSEIPFTWLYSAAESLHGSCELSRHTRFANTPLCYYQCPSAKGCNSMTGHGCFCPDEAAP